MKKFLLVILVGVFLCSISEASATTITVATSGEWTSWNGYQAGWADLSFDDSSWRNAYEDYGNHPDTAQFPELADAKTIWDWPDSPALPNGLNGPLKAYFRYVISLDGPVESSQFSYAVDDAMDLYINGQVVYSHQGAGNTNTPGYKAIDSSLFVAGNNIIAISAWDGSDSIVYNRGGEALTATFLLETNPVPEPTTMLLLGTGLAGLAGFRRKFKRS